MNQFLNFKKKEIINDFGATLLELLVTVAIIGIMSGVYLANYRSNNQKIILDQAVSGMVADLRLAQNMAMNVKKFNGAIPIGGYGINISGFLPVASYIIFADMNAGDKKYSGPAEKFAERALPDGIFIVSTDSFNDIDFEPPFPAIWIDGSQAAPSATITLQYGASGLVKTIIINRLTGQININ